ncbi:hypothetical protein BGX31_004349 [Mortierella sp. GBA43]|nr:hypothetical protein BGX31_004349 [Mortierella sp. GBA43]
MARDKLLVFKCDFMHRLALKDAYVALACTLDLNCQVIQKYFEPEYISAAVDAHCFLPASKRQTSTKPFMDALDKEGAHGLRKMVILEKAKYENLALDDQNGEAVSNCTKRLRRIIKSTAKEDPDFGRKVDLLFYVDRLELSNVEFKHQKTSNMDVKLQHLKNIRINRAIMEGQHQICGTRSAIVFMDVKGTQV